ncbi:MAG: class I SAM-dependent methyltransferase [Fretibacterium sp.]|nr:class I SAM-dependent methyltransferase [Fretibacterium sp.]
MLKQNKRLLEKILLLLDICLVPILFPFAWLLKNVRAIGMARFPQCRKMLLKIGVFPIVNHYYEPMFDNSSLDFEKERSLPAVDWNEEEQLEYLSRMNFMDELKSIPWDGPKDDPTCFYMNNPSFCQGDAAYWYQLIRLLKPERIIEIGSGNSTLIARKAIEINTNLGHACEHICIEPYEMPWLEQLNISIIRQKVEEVDKALFKELGEDDILFIDSSHIIRPDGDVLFEYLELLPSLNRGVVVHAHDIFSPRHYLRKWLLEDIRFWNEQYLLEAFLSHNCEWKIIGALNYLYHRHFDRFKKVVPFLNKEDQPGSFYMKKCI